jgi:hypothetical protein
MKQGGILFGYRNVKRQFNEARFSAPNQDILDSVVRSLLSHFDRLGIDHYAYGLSGSCDSDGSISIDRDVKKSGAFLGTRNHEAVHKLLTPSRVGSFYNSMLTLEEPFCEAYRLNTQDKTEREEALDEAFGLHTKLVDVVPGIPWAAFQATEEDSTPEFAMALLYRGLLPLMDALVQSRDHLQEVQCVMMEAIAKAGSVGTNFGRKHIEDFLIRKKDFDVDEILSLTPADFGPAYTTGKYFDAFQYDNIMAKLWYSDPLVRPSVIRTVRNAQSGL